MVRIVFDFLNMWCKGKSRRLCNDVAVTLERACKPVVRQRYNLLYPRGYTMLPITAFTGEWTSRWEGAPEKHIENFPAVISR